MGRDDLSYFYAIYRGLLDKYFCYFAILIINPTSKTKLLKDYKNVDITEFNQSNQIEFRNNV